MSCQCVNCGEWIEHYVGHVCKPVEQNISVPALKEQLDRLLSVVNAVTCPHRHGQPIRPKDLTRLCNRQIEVEEALRDMGYNI